jgi:hypothetical protein
MVTVPDAGAWYPLSVSETVAVHVVDPVYDIDDGEQPKAIVVVVWMFRVTGPLVELEP